MSSMNHPRNSSRLQDPARIESTGKTPPPAERRSYEPARLRPLGDLRNLTLGGSLGVGDSGNSGVQRF